MNTNFIVYLIGYLLVIAAVWFGLDAASVSQTWIIVAVLALLGVGIIYAFSRSQTDAARREQTRGGQAGTAQGGGTQQQEGNAPQGGTQA